MSAQAPADGATIVAVRNGPHRVSGACRLRNARGEDVPVRGRFVLCRCGNSSNKPFCDDTHAKIGFDGSRIATGPMGAPELHQGRRVTIHDNRAICAHSGVCTDNLPGVFRLGQEPWIDPDGAEAEAVMALVRRCPSGALSYTIDGQLPSAGPRERMIIASKNGPYFVTGGVALEAAGVTPRDPDRYALCR